MKSEAATGRKEAVMIRVRIPDTRNDEYRGCGRQLARRVVIDGSRDDDDRDLVTLRNATRWRELLIVPTATGKIAMRVVTLTRQQAEHDSVSWMSASEDEAAAILSHAVIEGWLIEPAWIKRALS